MPSPPPPGGRDPLRGADGLCVTAATGRLPALAGGVLVLQPLREGRGDREDPHGQLWIQEGRNTEPSAGSIDSQSVKGADTGGRNSRGYDAGFAGRPLDWATTILATTLHIVRKPAAQRGFAVIPRRWAVERAFAWIAAHRRLARDCERNPAVSEAMIRWAAINTITRRIARGDPATRQPRRVVTPRGPLACNLLLFCLVAGTTMRYDRTHGRYRRVGGRTRRAHARRIRLTRRHHALGVAGT